MPRGGQPDPRPGRGRAPNRRGHRAGGTAAGRGDTATSALRPRRLRPGLGAQRRSPSRRGSPDPARPALTGHGSPGPARPAGCGLRTAAFGLPARPGRGGAGRGGTAGAGHRLPGPEAAGEARSRGSGAQGWGQPGRYRGRSPLSPPRRPHRRSHHLDFRAHSDSKHSE
nr:translation initiation factor IF-2-like [Agelaius phoeniceus]